MLRKRSMATLSFHQRRHEHLNPTASDMADMNCISSRFARRRSPLTRFRQLDAIQPFDCFPEMCWEQTFAARLLHAIGCGRAAACFSKADQICGRNALLRSDE